VNGKDLVKNHEGYSERVYLDSLGYPTHGYGFLLEKKKYKTVREYHDALFDVEYAKAESLYAKLGLDLDDVRRCAVVDLCYNLGPQFANWNSTLTALQMKDYRQAANYLEQTRWYKQVGRRGPRICNLIREGKWEAL
jgi:GH24 family phage-related lysozyme (muramidase)